MKTSMTKYAFALAVFSVALTGCRKMPDVTPGNCKADSAANPRYESGRSRALSENETDRARGIADGAALGYPDGKEAGLDVAWDKGYNSANGHPKGYNEKYPIGYSQGYADSGSAVSGAQNGAINGSSDGQKNGYDDGYDDGHYVGAQDGDEDGYADGYEDGYYTGGWYAYENPDACYADAKSKKREERELKFQDDCEKLGYSNTRNASGSYNAGYAEGKASNAGYQQGLNDFKDDPTTIAAGTAQGYADGLVKGLADGIAQGKADIYKKKYDQAYSPAYTSAYNIAYPNGYSAGRYAGYNSAYDAAYEDGYDLGYDEGFYDQCDAQAGARQGTFKKASSSTARQAGGSSLRYKNSPAYLKRIKTRGAYQKQVYSGQGYTLGQGRQMGDWGVGRLKTLRQEKADELFNKASRKKDLPRLFFEFHKKSPSRTPPAPPPIKR